MKLHLRLYAIAILLIIIGTWYYLQKPTNQTINKPLTITTMHLTSQAFENNQNLPPKYTCDGENISPPLQISNVPTEAKSLVLIVDDPDAPIGDWVHWMVWNIPPTTTDIAEGSAPTGIQGVSDFGTADYGGPCPPNGTHRYFFKLYALNTTLNLPPTAKKTEIESAMEESIITRTELVGIYSRG